MYSKGSKLSIKQSSKLNLKRILKIKIQLNYNF